MIWTREEYIAHMTFEYTGKEMFTELFGLLTGLDNEWKSQDATPDELDLSAFGWDSVLYTDTACNTFAITSLSPYILEDNNEYTISVDYMGRTQKLIKSSATIALPTDYPVKDFDDWLKIKHWYKFDESRINTERLKKAKELHDKGYLTVVWIPGGFDEPRQLMGEENLCIAYYEQPELIHDMLNTIAETNMKVFERIFEYVVVDNISIHEDMAGKSGPLVGPSQIKEFITPYYLKIWNECKLHGTKLFSQDSDGNMNGVIDAFLDAGVNIMYPFEPNSGMDMVAARKKYGKRITFKGGIDKFALRGNKDDIKRELEYKMCGEMLGGGTIFAIDHRIPNGVPIENYRYYAELGRKLLGRTEYKSSPHIRMAF
ncbi:MAG: hypothetical protein FWD71_04975 [Oscillospiraceae bacterium]|nr:hypothetical protein [Oscillospiraceae bacterium]